MRTRLLLLSTLLASLLPISASALEGIGPRVTITGTVQEVHISEKQRFNELGGELIIKASNGQIVTIVLQDTVKIISEGRLSRKQLLAVNIVPNMLVRVHGWRVDSQSLTASLVIIVNIQLNPALSLSGTLQSVDGNKISVLSQDGQTREFTVTNETQVSVGYDLTGTDGLSLLGKEVLLTLNPMNQSYVRILRITGRPALR